ncbi:hypothetical protein BDW68DRAFT_52820 [Aspergillus falconensis]
MRRLRHLYRRYLYSFQEPGLGKYSDTYHRPNIGSEAVAPLAPAGGPKGISPAGSERRISLRSRLFMPGNHRWGDVVGTYVFIDGPVEGICAWAR